jgi:hypothetical protein
MIGDTIKKDATHSFSKDNSDGTWTVSCKLFDFSLFSPPYLLLNVIGIAL